MLSSECAPIIIRCRGCKKRLLSLEIIWIMCIGLSISVLFFIWINKPLLNKAVFSAAKLFFSNAMYFPKWALNAGSLIASEREETKTFSFTIGSERWERY